MVRSRGSTERRKPLEYVRFKVQVHHFQTHVEAQLFLEVETVVCLLDSQLELIAATKEKGQREKCLES
jgi:hypothetical protein